MNGTLCDELILLEENARLIYLDFAMTCDTHLKEAMLDLSSQEETHKDIVRKLLADVDIDAIRYKTEELIKDQQLLKLDKKIMSNDRDFFNAALNTEKKSIEIYTACRSGFDSGSASYKGLSALIDEEHSHMIYILKLLQNLK